MLPEVLSEDSHSLNSSAWPSHHGGEQTPHRGGSRFLARILGLSPYSPLLKKVLVRFIAFPPGAMEYSIPGFPPMADVKCLTLCSNLSPKPVHTQI